MPWQALDDQFYDHPKTVQAGTAGAGLFALTLSYCGRHLTDGFVSSAMVRKLASDVDDPIALADRLVDAGFFERVDGGYQVHDYLDYQPSKEDVIRQRAENARRQAAWKSAHTGKGETSAPAGNAVSNGVTNALINMPPSPNNNDKDKDDCSDPPADAVALYVQANPGVNPLIVDDIKALIAESEEFRLKLPRGSAGADKSGEVWVTEAVKRSIRSAKSGFNLNYVKKVLGSMEREGYNERSGPGARAPTGAADYSTSSTVTAEQIAERVARASAPPPDVPGWQLWEDIKGELKLSMTRATFDNWIAPTTVAGQGNGTLTLAAKSEDARAWLDGRLRGQIEKTAAALAGRPMAIAFA